PDVVSLTVQRRGIVDLEEELEQVPIGDLLRVEDDLDRLGVAFVIAVGRVRNVAARVAHARGENAGPLPEEVLHSPETPTGENRLLGLAHIRTSNAHFTLPSTGSGCSGRSPGGLWSAACSPPEALPARPGTGYGRLQASLHGGAPL